MRFDPIHVTSRTAGPLGAIGRLGVPDLPGACTSLAVTALLVTFAASLAVSRGGLAWFVLPLSLLLFLPVAGFVLVRIGDHPHDRFGPANVVTLLRGGMAALIGACAFEIGPTGTPCNGRWSARRFWRCRSTGSTAFSRAAAVCPLASGSGSTWKWTPS